MPPPHRDRRVAELLDFVGLLPRAHSYPEQLSGGQKQRVGIARALATKPQLLLADEATSALDPDTTADVLELLRRVNRDLGVTIVVITHEMEAIRSIANRVAVMDAGRIVERGDVYDVFSAPSTEITARFVRSVLRNRPSGRTLARLRQQHPGTIVSVELQESRGFQAMVHSVFEAQAIGCGDHLRWDQRVAGSLRRQPHLRADRRISRDHHRARAVADARRRRDRGGLSERLPRGPAHFRHRDLADAVHGDRVADRQRVLGACDGRRAVCDPTGEFAGQSCRVRRS